MSKPIVSVVMVTYNRAHLLWRSIMCYNRLNFNLNKLEIIVVDDGSTDDTQQKCEMFDSRIDVKYIKLRKPKGLWRDCAANINVGLRAASGQLIMCTHPEVMPDRESLNFSCANVTDENWISLKGYYLSPRDQERIDTVDWLDKGPSEVNKIEGFYDEREGHPDYMPKAIEAVGNGGHPAWLSWIFGGTTRKLWSWLGGFIETDTWGSVDLLMLNRRNVCGIKTVTAPDMAASVVHQNHDVAVGDFIPTNRDMEKCHAAAPWLNIAKSSFPEVDNLWGPYP